jgi:broad specificity phosphatase PhoE
MKAIFLRHGETTYNVKKLITQDSNIDVHLTAKGKKQAMEAGKKLEAIEFDAVFISDFIRTRETSEIVLRNRNIEPIVDLRISEVKTGYEGRSVDEFNLDSAHDFFNFKEKGKGNESWHESMKRVRDFIKYIKKEKYENVLVVTHEWIIKMADEIINGIDDEESRKIKVGNCEFYEFEI